MALTLGTHLGSYEIVAALGAGGMGEVYLARDTKLNRQVAIKVLLEAFAQDADRLARFESEARTLAALNHPNIAQIYGLEDANGVKALVMELVEGPTLADCIAKGPIPINGALTIGRQITEALAEAHARGIVHRDLKPANIKVREDGTVKVLDFGLAKSVSPADPTGLTTFSTTSGLVMGTVGYMSPEQARGHSVDHRTDIFALGAILHEMVVGRPAFHGDTPADTISAVLRDEPTDLSTRRDIPFALAQIVTRCLRKNPDERFRSARDLRLALASISSALLPVSPIHVRDASIAVLPFANMSVDHDNDYFSDGLAEELINALTRLRGLHVAARTSAFRFRGRDLDIRDIGRQLNVATVLEGSVRRAGKHLRISAKLINVADGYHLWAERYDRDLDDVFKIQDEITTSIVRTLEPTLLGDQLPLVSRHSNDVRAFELYLEGQQLWHQRTPQTLRAAVRSFGEAVALDGNYALAHAGLAACYAIMAAYGFASFAQATAAAQPAAVRAMLLAPQLAESHFAMALYTFVLTRDWHDAETHFRKAVEIEPRAAMTQVHFGFYLTTRHRFVEGIEHVFEAIEIDALSPFVHGLGALSMYIARRYDDAIRLGERALELHPEFTLASWTVALARARIGHHERAIALLERAVMLSGRAPVYVGLWGFAHAIAGHRVEAAALLEELRTRAQQEYVLPLAPLAIEIGLGDRDSIIEALRSYLDHGYNGTGIEDTLGPYIDELFSDSRIAELFDRLGLVLRRPDSGSMSAAAT